MWLQDSVDRGKEIEYVVKRLIHGLSSARECARLGFSTVLTHVRLAELIPHFACRYRRGLFCNVCRTCLQH